jgi:hypothetical protein
MWTPKQWWVAFPVLSAVMIMLGAVWIRTAASDTQWLVAITAGVIAGLFIAVGWMFRPLLVAVTILCMTAAIVVICAAEATADYGTLSALVAIAIAAAWIVTYERMYIATLSRPVSREAEHFGEPTAPRRALMIYQPTPHGFLVGHLRTLAQALTQQGLKVELAATGTSGPARPSDYDLLILATPAWGFRPARALVEYVRKLDLREKQTLLVVSGFGMTESTMRTLHGLVQSKGARVIWTVEIWTERPNSERHGTNDAIEIMRRAAAAAGHAMAR